MMVVAAVGYDTASTATTYLGTKRDNGEDTDEIGGRKKSQGGRGDNTTAHHRIVLLE